MINIFYKPAFLNTASSVPFVSKKKSYKGRGHLQRVSSMIRADQVADAIGARLNPEQVFDDDICIYVKPHIKAEEDFKFQGKRSYLDIIDGWGLIPVLEKHPEVNVIVCSKQDEEKLKAILPNKIIYIPQHHCNYKRVKRNKKRITRIGIIGTEDAFKLLPSTIQKGLNERGLNFVKYSKFFSKQDIINFYKSIDIQIVWRPYRMRLSNPLKIVNASSFGIPTVAFEESVFHEVTGSYLPVQTVEELLSAIDRLRMNEKFYSSVSSMCLDNAEKYHIENVGKLYKAL